MPAKVPTHRTPRIGPDRHRLYDRTSRDRDAKAFYLSWSWKRLRLVKLARDPACEECLARDQLEPATVVHHVVEIAADPSRRLDVDNLRSLCASCHSSVHRRQSDHESNAAR